MAATRELSNEAMALLNKSVVFKKFDVRMVERNLHRGVITQKQFEDSLSQLPDDGENAEWVSTESLEESEGPELSNGKPASEYHDSH